MKRRTPAEPGALGTFLQILLVGVLLFAVIWQVGDSVDRAEAPRDIPEAPAEAIAEVYVTIDEVNLRTGPGTGYEILSVVPLHAEVTVTGPGSDGFLPVTVDGTAAWIAADYLLPAGSVLASSSGDVPVIDAPDAAGSPLTELLVQDVSAAELPVTDPDPEPPVDTAPDPTEAPFDEAPVSVAAETFTEPIVEEPGERWIEVDRSTATVTLHEGDRVVAQYNALIGKDPSVDGYYATAVGTFYVHVKERQLAETPFAPGVYLSDFVGFDPARSNGFHSPTRDKDGNIVQTGGTATLGCVRLGEDEAKFLFDFASIGMRVEIHD